MARILAQSRILFVESLRQHVDTSFFSVHCLVRHVPLTKTIEGPHIGLWSNILLSRQSEPFDPVWPWGEAAANGRLICYEVGKYL
jgi:hypothetical protein